MAQTLEELFNNGTLQRGPYTGQTPKDAFTPRNGNKIPLSSNSPVINATTMKLVNKLRSGNGSTLQETVLEQETTGIRVLGTLSQPLLYGAELGRITLRQTAPLAEMKIETSGIVPSGPIGKVFKSVRTFATKTLGIPTLATPTFTNNFSDFKIGSLEGVFNVQKQYPKLLAGIKDSANGTLFGRLLKGGLGSLTDTDQLKAKVIGEALKFGKGLLREKLITGERKPSANPYDWASMPISEAKFAKPTQNYGKLINSSAPLLLDAFGTTYQSNIKVTVQDKIDTYEKFVSSTNREIPIFTKKTKQERKEEGGILAKIPFPKLDLNKEISKPKRTSKISDLEKTKKNKTTPYNNIKSKYGESSFGNIINQTGVYIIGEEPKKDDKTPDELDTIVLKFESVKQNKAVNFLSTISGLSETMSPSWDSAKFIGNPFSFYTYSGMERSVGFSFKVFSLNPEEHKICWNKLNFLTSLTYPQDYEGDPGYITPPFLRLTIGDMYKRKEGFLSSLSYTIDDGSPWEIGNLSGEDGNGSSMIASLTDDVSIENYKLPRIVNVQTEFKFIEQRNSLEGHRYYPFIPITETTT
tara:strand:+ start:4338 stop:6083 length:1746 start_codon:yes stop_codon:yes gene_type:complete